MAVTFEWRSMMAALQQLLYMKYSTHISLLFYLWCSSQLHFLCISHGFLEKILIPNIRLCKCVFTSERLLIIHQHFELCKVCKNKREDICSGRSVVSLCKEQCCLVFFKQTHWVREGCLPCFEITARQKTEKSHRAVEMTALPFGLYWKRKDITALFPKKRLFKKELAYFQHKSLS